MPQPLRTCAAAQPDQNRQALLEWLYLCDGRQDPSHPDYGTYTGLYQRAAESIGRDVLAELEHSWHLFGNSPTGDEVLRLEIDLMQPAP